MAERLDGTRVAFLLTDGVEQIEFTDPWGALKGAGAEVTLVSPAQRTVLGMHGDEKADTFEVDRAVADASASEYDALVLPGGVVNADHLRMDADAVRFVREFFEQHKPVAAICHAPWLLIEAGVARGRNLTSYPSLKTDLVNAGAIWTDSAAVVDHGLVTSRTPDDLPAFIEKSIDQFAHGEHAGQTV